MRILERIAFVYYDDKKRFPSLQKLCPQAEFRFVKDLPAADALREAAAQGVLLALENRKLRAAVLPLRDAPGARLYVLPYDVRSAADPVGIDLSKPRLDYMETEITRVCNLNCRGCCDFSNLANEPGGKFYDYDRYVSDLRQMKKLFWGIEKIRIMGGEPLLNPRLAEYAEAAREIFPDSDLRIVTNGLLLSGLSADVLARVKAADCSFDISNYPPTHRKKAEILHTLKNAEVACNFSVPMRFFFRNILEVPVDDPAPAFNNCIFSHCHMMGDGKLAPCSYAYCISRFNRRFGASYPETDFVDLYAEGLNGWDIRQAFSQPHEFCRCCGSGIIPFRWKGGVHSSDAKKEDWQIRRSFINTTLAPKAQRLVKNAAMTLRARIQKKQ